MRIQNRCQTLRFIILLPTLFNAAGRKNTGHLCKHPHRMDVTYIANDISIRVLIFQQKCTQIGLTTLHHVLKGRNDRGVTDNDGFVESREERSSSNRESEDLGVGFGNGLFGYGG